MLNAKLVFPHFAVWLSTRLWKLVDKKDPQNFTLKVEIVAMSGIFSSQLFPCTDPQRCSAQITVENE